MDVLNALNFDPSNLALDMILLGALAVGFRSGIMALNLIVPKIFVNFLKPRTAQIDKGCKVRMSYCDLQGRRFRRTFVEGQEEMSQEKIELLS